MENSDQQKDLKDNEEAEVKAINKDEQKKEKVLDENKEENQQEDFKNKFLYLAAEFENFKRRTEKERQNLLKFGSEKVLTDLLEVVDNLERTFQAIEKDEDEKVKNISVGIKMVVDQFIQTLSRHGLGSVESLGKTFDPNFHEAMGQEKVEGKGPQEIIREYQKGYLLNGKLIRAAKVIVTE